MLAASRTSKAVPSSQALGTKTIALAIYGLAGILFVVFVLCTLSNRLRIFDDSIILLHGRLINQGLRPNIDFFSFYPPLNLYITAIALKVFGETVVISRLLQALWLAILVVTAHWAWRPYFGNTALLLPASVLLVVASAAALIDLAPAPGFAFAAIAFLVYVRALSAESPNLRLMAAAGFLTGLAILTRINFGLYVVATVGTSTFLHWLAQRDFTASTVRRLAVTLGSFLVPAFGTVAILSILIFGSHIPQAIQEFVLEPARVMKLRGFQPLYLDSSLAIPLLFGPLWFFFRAIQDQDSIPLRAWFAAATGPVLVAVGVALAGKPSVVLILVLLQVAAVIAFQFFVKRLHEVEFATLLFCCFLSHYYLSRADWDHWRLMPIGQALLIPWLAFRYKDENRPQSVEFRGLAFPIGIIIALSFLLLVSDSTRPSYSHVKSGLTLVLDYLKQPRRADSDLVAASPEIPPVWKRMISGDNDWHAARYVAARTAPDEPVFVGWRDHSRTFWSNLRMYWLLNRKPGVRRFQLEDRVTTEAPVQRQMIDDLQRLNVRWLILDYEQTMPNDPAFKAANYQGATILDEYLRANYSEVTRIGPYSIQTLNSAGNKTAHTE
jgi:hypothetical protein